MANQQGLQASCVAARGTGAGACEHRIALATGLPAFGVHPVLEANQQRLQVNSGAACGAGTGLHTLGIQCPPLPLCCMCTYSYVDIQLCCMWTYSYVACAHTVMLHVDIQLCCMCTYSYVDIQLCCMLTYSYVACGHTVMLHVGIQCPPLPLRCMCTPALETCPAWTPPCIYLRKSIMAALRGTVLQEPGLHRCR